MSGANAHADCHRDNGKLHTIRTKVSQAQEQVVRPPTSSTNTLAPFFPTFANDEKKLYLQEKTLVQGENPFVQEIRRRHLRKQMYHISRMTYSIHSKCRKPLFTTIDINGTICV